jgi:lipid A 3-O-deacylase
MKYKLFFLAACIFCSTRLLAQTHTDEIGAQSDNDSYLLQGSDRYYTDGYFMYFRHAMVVKDTAKLQNKVLGFELGQKIFNPQTGSISDINGVDHPEYIDRPFAAYLYVGSTLNYLYSNESNLKLSAQFGIIGPNAYGRQVQTYVHQLLGFYKPSGWEYQIDNNVVLNLSAEYNRLLARTSELDVSLTSYVNLGNGFSGAGLGPLFRLGNFNQLFNSVSTQSTVSRGIKKPLLHKHEIFLYYKPQINYVAYDATIQGGLFTSHNPNSLEITADKEPFIVSNQVGLAFTTNRFVFDIAVIFHSIDDKEMVQSHQWGSITGLYRFK